MLIRKQTYGIQAINQSSYEEAIHNYTRPGGCHDQLLKCQDKLRKIRPEGLSIRSEAGEPGICSDILDEWCDGTGERLFEQNNNARFDITHPKADPFPPPHMIGYLTQASVLEALGSPVNFSLYSPPVSKSFDATKDGIHGGFLDAIAYLLDTGVKVHMMYGDRDFACNWVGGETASLAVPYSRQDEFKKAGYTPLISSKGHGGETRQFGNYSFTRVFQAGHMIPSYQPEAAYAVFMRALFNKDIATGKKTVHDGLSTKGPSSVFHIKTEVQKAPKPKCYILAPESCEKEEWKKVTSGDATIKDYFLVNDSEESEGPDNGEL